MRRRLFNIASGVSLLLCIAVVMLWLWSHFRKYELRFTFADQTFFLLVQTGALGLGWDSDIGIPSGTRISAWDPDERSLDDPDHVFAGWGFTYDATADGGTFRGISVPDWTIILLSAAAFVYFLRRHRQTQFSGGCCRTCGYNLTANTSGVCPECGAQWY